MKQLFLAISLLSTVCSFAQPSRWQQKVNYKIKVDLDVHKNTFRGTQQIEYWNNSPDALGEVFFHLYLNAFKPRSSMDNRSLRAGKILVNKKPDWDSRVKSRISKLGPDEVGDLQVPVIKMNGVVQQTEYYGTVLKVNLNKKIAPNTKVVFEMSFTGQVPLQVRRTGRDNPDTKVRFSMSQWYPKLAEYDREGWHANPYIAREFYGVWGNYTVDITLDKNYKIGGTGVLKNAAEIGWGYDQPGTALKPVQGEKRTWKFIAENVHDFVWAADPDYKHLVRTSEGTKLHVIYKNLANDEKVESKWKEVADAAQKVLPFMNKNFGKYPYPQYSFIHGGDGGMEYPMATLIVGPSIGTAFHEWMHSWYQMMMGTNESLYGWMDEGFTSYGEELVMTHYTGLTGKQLADSTLTVSEGARKWKPYLPEMHTMAYLSYYNLQKSGLEEPLTTHADHFNTNYAYVNAAYNKGEVFMEQLGYIIGASVRDSLLLDYYNNWRFKHPDVNDFIMLAQKRSGMQLQWYRQYWVNSTKSIDYAVDSVWLEQGITNIRLKRIGLMPMPIDVLVTNADGSSHIYNIPLDLMFGSKKAEDKTPYSVEKYWDWTAETYLLKVPAGVSKIEIDPTHRLPDIDPSNNSASLK